MIFGVVEGAGPNIADRREWRAAFARPLSLYVPPEHLQASHGAIGRVAERYAVPVLRDLDALVRTWGRREAGPGAMAHRPARIA